jgi:NAD(P)-dependent dehydrogenase (short-subunit alcohol dehydrogenase family)
MQMQDKVCLITGATSGHGRACARALARMGAKIILLARDEERCLVTQREIRAQAGSTAPEPEFVLCDLSSQRQTRRAAEEILERGWPIDVLINNAGLVRKNRELSEDGVELTFAVNYLSHFLLTNLLMERLRRGPAARIINVSSDTHRIATLPLDDPEHQRGYWFMSAYGRSKLAMVYFTVELARRLSSTNVTANAVDPGPVDSRIARDNPGITAKLLPWVTRYFFPSPDEACRTAVELAASPAFENTSGGYFKYGKRRRPSMSRSDPYLPRKLWLLSERLTDLTFSS